MEPWQYSSLQTQLSSLLHLLSGSSKSNSTKTSSAQVENMNVDHGYSDTIRIGIKRKMSDVDNTDPSRKTRRIQMGSCSSLTLDMYTQTDMSFLSNHSTTLANISEVVEQNQRRLGSIEQLLAAIDNKITMFITENTNSDNNNDYKSSAVKTPKTPLSSTMDFTSDVDRSDELQTVSPQVETKTELSLGEDQTNSRGLQQMHRQDSCSSSRAESLLAKSLPADIGLQDVVSDVVVPVIFAVDSKRKATSTAEVPLQDLLNSNVANPEDNVSSLRGCWLGNRLDADSRVWYYGDPRIIQRAEASGTNPAKLSLNLLEALCTRDEMAASNVNGARGRELLDPIKIKAIYAHINHKFPTESDKQELRWHLLKPRIDSKCRAQRRFQRDHQVFGGSESGQSSINEKPFRSKVRLYKPAIDPKIRDELLYGPSTPQAHTVSYVTMATTETDESSRNLEPAQNDQHSPIVVFPQ